MKDRKINFSIRDITGKEFKFDSFKNLKKFSSDECKFWTDVRNMLPGKNIGHIYTHSNVDGQFSQLNSHLESFERNLESWSDEDLQNQIRQHLNGISSQIAGSWVWSGHPFCKRWVEVYETYGAEPSSAFIEAFVGNQQFRSINTVNGLKGAVLAYEFLMQDESTLTKRRSSERASISQVRNSLIDAKDQLFTDVLEFQNEFQTWNDKIKSAAERLYNVNKKLGERISRKQRKQFDAQMDEWQQRMEHLEQTYQEKLRLEKPAAYWNTKAASYFRQGIWWSVILSVVLAIGLIAFSIFFNSWLQGQKTGVDLNSLQGAVIFITIISIYALTLKTLAKMVFSSFHLQRDAEEREQLTHVYLALTHEKDELDIEARNIILQALFSRADTGLLGSDSGPTMPGVHEIFRASAGK